MLDDTPHLLVVDDHPDIRETLARYLERHGLRVTAAEDAAGARRLLKTLTPDLVLLDIMMPGEDGLSLCRFLRENTELPLIFLTAAGEATDRILGLEMGADDYVIKPFEPRELLARVKAVLRRTRSAPGQRRFGYRMRFDRWIFDTARRELTDADGVAVSLSAAEFLLLDALVRHPGIVLTRDQLLELTRGRSADAFDRSIDNQVSRLRRKIEADPKTPALIKTVWGGGYRFSAEVRRL